MRAFDIPLSWPQLLKRTLKETNEDDCLGLAAQLAYYFFLALFPAILFLLALASFFPLTNFIGQAVAALRPFAPAEVLNFLEEQLRRLSNANSGGILTLGFLGAIWSSSAAVVAIIGSLNRAYDIDEGRPWWKVRLTAIGLTLALAATILVAFSLIVVGPTVAEHLTASFGFGAVFEWTWKILQWPLAFFLVSTAVGLVYYFAPDAEQDWVWITPGANTSIPSVTTDGIRSQIKQTRAKMSETIDAIQNRLSPRRVMKDAKEKVKDATIGRVKDLINRSGEFGNGGRTSFGAERAIQVVKSNPAPVALIVAAVAALTVGAWMRSRNGTSRTANIRDTHAGHATRRGFGRNKRTLLLSACSGFACWRAWRAHDLH